MAAQSPLTGRPRRPPLDAVLTVRRAVRLFLSEPEVSAWLGSGQVFVAVSGGADSLALAEAAAHVGRRRGLTVGALVVDHGLQAGSAEVAEWAAQTALRLGVDTAKVLPVTVSGGGGPEAAARRARYAALREHAGDDALVLFGHTRDDQAETVLLRLARGSGARSLAAMSPRSGRYLRPLLDLDRRTVHAAAALMGLEPWADPHNTDPAYARSRVRHDALPVLERVLGPGIAESLARTATLLRDDADALDEWADRAEQQAGRGTGALDVASLAALPRAIRTRLLRRAALAAGCPAGALTAEHVFALDRLVTDWRGQSHVDLPGARRGRRSGGRIVVSAED